MGHAIFDYRGRDAIINDLDIWALRHFVLTEAEAAGCSELANFVRGWDWIGVGVYLGIGFDPFFNGDQSREQSFLELLQAARLRIESFGSHVPLDYIKKNINLADAYYTASQPTQRWIQQIDKLRELLMPKQLGA